jgi:hypothetical protein
MTPALRKHLVSELIRGIGSIGPLFEAFGQRFVDLVVEVPMTHRGVNAEGQPVGNTVDSYSGEGDVVAEYSSQKDYFDHPYSKIRKDWLHVRKMHSQARRVLLIAGREAGPKAMTRVTNFVSRVKERKEIELETYDSRRIAEYIIDKLLLDDNAVDRLAPFLGPLRKIRDEYAISHTVPDQAPGYVAPRHSRPRSAAGCVSNGSRWWLGSAGWASPKLQPPSPEQSQASTTWWSGSSRPASQP